MEDPYAYMIENGLEWIRLRLYNISFNKDLDELEKEPHKHVNKFINKIYHLDEISECVINLTIIKKFKPLFKFVSQKFKERYNVELWYFIFKKIVKTNTYLSIMLIVQNLDLIQNTKDCTNIIYQILLQDIDRVFTRTHSIIKHAHKQDKHILLNFTPSSGTILDILLEKLLDYRECELLINTLRTSSLLTLIVLKIKTNIKKYPYFKLQKLNRDLRRYFIKSKE